MISGDSRSSAMVGTISGPSCVASVGGWKVWEIIELNLVMQ